MTSFDQAVAALVVVPDAVGAVERSPARAWAGAPVLLARPGRTVVGRGQGADAVLPYRSLSRRHVRLDLPLGAPWQALDLHSTNGTWVNERRVPAGGALVLRPGDLLRLGAVRLHVALPAQVRALGIGVALGAEGPLRLPPEGVPARSLVGMLATSPGLLERLAAPFLLQVPDASARWGSAAAASATVVRRPRPASPGRGELGAARVHSLGTAARAIVGRDDATAHVVLLVDGVSRSHATLFRGRRSWHVVDLGSRNGTRVNGALVPPGLSVPVDARSVLTFGTYQALLLAALDLAGLVDSVDLVDP